MTSKERPILFSAPMVRAILEGRKTQTRRIVKMPSDLIDRVQFVRAEFADKSTPGQCGAFWAMEGDGPVGPPISCKYGQAGDRLWVRETWMEDHSATTDEHGRLPILYRATCLNHPAERWRPSIHMPRWASRIDLEVTGVRVERLQDISEADAIAEGLDRVNDGAAQFGVHGLATSWRNDPREAFCALWESINGDRSWDTNPFVWVIEFKRIKP